MLPQAACYTRSRPVFGLGIWEYCSEAPTEGAAKGVRMLQLNRRSLDDIAVLDVAGHVDLSNCGRLHEAIIEELEAGNRKLLLNLKDLNFIDSSCLGVMLRGLELVHRHHGSMVLVGNQFVDRVLTLTGLTHLLVSYPDEIAAAQALRSEEKRHVGGA